MREVGIVLKNPVRIVFENRDGSDDSRRFWCRPESDQNRCQNRYRIVDSDRRQKIWRPSSIFSTILSKMESTVSTRLSHLYLSNTRRMFTRVD